MADPLSPLASALEGRYRFEAAQPDGSSMLGQGGMAIVYAARDLKLGREVAIKVFREEIARLIGPDRFLREIRIAASLAHPHILPLYDSGAAADRLFYVMPRIRGETLRQRLQRERILPVAQAISLSREIADGLDYAHRRDVIHRDIKPENILLADGHALIADFGVARSISDRDTGAPGPGRLTGSGMAVGTVQYMSPEQRSGSRELDGRSDLFSLGCILFEMLTGDPPALPSGGGHNRSHSDPVLSALHAARPELSRRLDRVMRRTLAADVNDRFASAAEMADALAAFQPGRRQATSALLLVTLVLLVGFGGRWLWARNHPARTEKVPVLVANFEGSPLDSSTARLASELAVADFNQSVRFTTVAPEQLVAARRASRLPADTPIDVGLARSLATRLAVGAVVTGSVQRLDSVRYALIVRAVSPGDGRDLAVATGSASSSDLVHTLGQLLRDLRSSLGERRKDLEASRPLWLVTTPSLEAYQLFVRAGQQLNRGDHQASSRLVREALSIDSTFASAWRVLASNFVAQRELDSAAAAYAIARRFSDRMPTLERFLLNAEIASAIDADLEEAIRWNSLALDQVPTCVVALTNRGVDYASTGRYELALADLTRAAQLTTFGDYEGQLELLNKAVTLAILDRAPEGEALAKGLTRGWDEYAQLVFPVARGQWNEVDSVSRVLELASSNPAIRTQASVTLAASFAARGHVRDALRSLQRLWSGAAVDVRAAARATLLLCAANGCDLTAVPAPLARDTSARSRIIRGVWLSTAGDNARADLIARTLDSLTPANRRRLHSDLVLLSASRSAGRGNWRDVIDQLGAPALAGEHDVLDPDRFPPQAMRWLVAEAYERTGRPDSAARYFTLLARPVRIPWWSFAMQGFTGPVAQRKLTIGG